MGTYTLGLTDDPTIRTIELPNRSSRDTMLENDQYTYYSISIIRSTLSVSSGDNQTGVGALSTTNVVLASNTMTDGREATVRVGRKVDSCLRNLEITDVTDREGILMR